MTKNITVTPQGELWLVDAPDEAAFADAGAVAALVAEFDRSSAAGVVLLATPQFGSRLPASFVFWRDFGRQVFRRICQLGEAGVAEWKSVPAPPEEELQDLVDEAPPMRGLEYLNADVLRRLWRELAEVVAEQAKRHKGGPADYLQTINPLWHLIGKVTFHLAENKRDADRPFAFLATFTNQMSAGAKPQHLPLADALRMYAESKDRAKLELLLEPVRRAARSSPLIGELLDSKALFAPQAWKVQQAYRFLSESPQMEEAGVVVRVPNWWAVRRKPRPKVQVKLGSKPASQVGLDAMLEFRVDMAIDGEPLTEEERDQLLNGTEGLSLLRGKWVEVDREKLQEALEHWEHLQEVHPDGLSFIEGMRLLSGVQLDPADAVDEEVQEWSRITSGDWLEQTLERLRHPDASGDCQPGRDLQATLRPYQAVGVQWLWFMTELGLGACLADDMGLGKTIQVIDLLLQYKHRDSTKAATNNRPSLLVVPASLIGNWREELAKFAPSLKVFFAHRSECDADTLARLAKEAASELAEYDLVVTTYGLVRREKWLADMPWSLAILDEAQAIKNASSSQTKSVKAIEAKGRIVLTGTPVENQLGDLWSLFDFCSPGLLGNASQFKKLIKRLNTQQDAQAFGSLRQLVRPYILRRMKTDPTIVPDLPEKTEMRTDCCLTKKQAVLYQNAVDELEMLLEKKDGIERKGLVLAMLMQLKQICNHPAQYLKAAAFVPEESGKFERLRLLCEPIAERQEKALIFTQFQSMTQPLANYLATVFGGPGLVLDGGTPVKKRPELVKIFQNDPRHAFFVISLKAGGSGLNLTAASHVIHFDRWWNPAVENQATDRAFRIGQKRNVLVHKFVCRGTVEERIDGMIRDKLDLADKILNEDSAPLLTEMSNADLLKFVALDVGRAAEE